VSTLTKTDYHQCEGIKGDGEPCTKRAKEFFGPPYGWRCGVHSAIGLLRQQQLDTYEKHQRAAFGGLVMTWTDDHLLERFRMTQFVPDGSSEERGITIRAEHDAVAAEMDRRRAG
jgi:hypothetical protein